MKIEAWAVVDRNGKLASDGFYYSLYRRKKDAKDDLFTYETVRRATIIVEEEK